MKTLYAFDFDGTITNRDTLLEFIRHVFGTPRMVWGFALCLPWIILMRLGLYDNGKAKQRVFSHFFKGMSIDDFNDYGRRFAESHRHIIRPDMAALLVGLQQEQADVVVVSASITNWVRPFFDTSCLTVIGTEAEVYAGRLTGRFATPNCYGPEKVRRLLEVRPDRSEYELIAYGDSRGDREMLQLADKHFMCKESQGRTNLQWLLKAFHVKREERLPSLLVLLFFIAANLLVVNKYFSVFSLTDGDLLKQQMWTFEVSGFDPITYTVLSSWDASYDPHRHPLLAFFLYPFGLLNTALTSLVGINLVQFVVMVPLVFFAYYSFLFAYRICREIIGVSRFDAILLSYMLFSFAYVTLTFVVPDHFAPSMLMLLMAIYVSGKCMQRGRRLNIRQTWLLFLFTAGTTLSNGVKVYIDALFVNGRNMFRPKYVLLAVVLPCALMWAFATWEYNQFTKPRQEKAKAKMIADGKVEREELFAQFCDTTSLKDSARIKAVFDHKMKVLRHERWLANRKKMNNVNKGEPLENEGFLKWTDISTPRWESLVENVFGESIQFHSRFLLGDIMRSRPAIVEYDSWLPYAVEAAVVFLFVLGMFVACRSRFFLMMAKGVAFDTFIHVVLGFGLNEVYIMSAHWIFIIPISIAFLLKRAGGWPLRLLRLSVMALVVYLYVYNMSLFVGHFMA